MLVEILFTNENAYLINIVLKNEKKACISNRSNRG